MSRTFTLITLLEWSTVNVLQPLTFTSLVSYLCLRCLTLLQRSLLVILVTVTKHL